MEPIKKLSVQCLGCRKQLPSKIRYCPHCGTKLPQAPFGIDASRSVLPAKKRVTVTIKKQKLSFWWWVAYFLLLFFVAAMVFGILALASTQSFLYYHLVLLYWGVQL